VLFVDPADVSAARALQHRNTQTYYDWADLFWVFLAIPFGIFKNNETEAKDWLFTIQCGAGYDFGSLQVP
jgi:hypothetical protein